jgi:hypothetical protein
MVVAAAALLLGACEARVGGNEGEPIPENAAIPENAQAVEGQIAFKGAGVEFKLPVPEMGNEARADDGDGLVYSGATITGLNIDATAADGKDGGAVVSMRFTSGDAPEKVAAWYRDPARAAQFSLTPETAKGTGHRLEGSTRDEGESFRLDLAAKAGGGTDASLAIRDRSRR